MGILPDYGSIIRGFSGPNGHNDQPISQPRLAYTFVLAFNFNADASIGNMDVSGIKSGKFFTSVKSITRPSFEFETEKLRSYNTYYNIQKKIQYKDVQLVLYDDSTSFVQGLIKAYRAYYSYSGNKTSDKSDINRYGLDTAATASTGDAPYGNRLNSGLPSLGMRIQAQPFFDNIKIFDLGSEPNSLNIYTLIHPKITTVEMGTLDYSANTLQEVTLGLNYEDYNEEIGVGLKEALAANNFFGDNQISSETISYDTRSGTFDNGTSENLAAGTIASPVANQFTTPSNITTGATGILDTNSITTDGSNTNVIDILKNFGASQAQSTISTIPVKNTSSIVSSSDPTISIISSSFISAHPNSTG